MGTELQLHTSALVGTFLTKQSPVLAYTGVNLNKQRFLEGLRRVLWSSFGDMLGVRGRYRGGGLWLLWEGQAEGSCCPLGF
jgi:hypothetical protein